MLNENDIEYIVRAKNTEIEYKNKSYKKTILALICFIILALVFLSNLATIYDVEVQKLVYGSIKLLIVGVLLFIAIYLLKTFLEIKIEKTEKIKMLKLIDNSIIIKTRLKVYVIKYRDLIEIKLRHVGDAETANYTIRIVIKYIEDGKINELHTHLIPINDYNNIRSVFISNKQIQEESNNEYHDVRSSGENEYIKKLLMEDKAERIKLKKELLQKQKGVKHKSRYHALYEMRKYRNRKRLEWLVWLSLFYILFSIARVIIMFR